MIDQSLWRAESPPEFPAAPLPREVDVAIIGGGITGLTAAWLLKQSGKRVAVFEREQVGGGESGSTSAHLTYVTDERITDLAEQFGREAARTIWQGQARAIDLIESAAEAIAPCGFRRVPGFMCAPFPGDLTQPERDALIADAQLASELGFQAQFHLHGPVTGKPAVSFADQAVFHPLEYLYGLAKAVDGDGSYVRCHCEVGEVIADPLAVVVNGETIACTDVIVATHVPMVGVRNLLGATLFQTKLYPYSSYVMGARVDNSLPPGLYDDTSDPYYYLRIHEDEHGRYAIFGGEDHKTGQETDTESRYAALEQAFLRFVPSAQIERRWSGQVIETDDGLPFVGEVAEHQYVATGYSGNGLTFGTVAAMIIHDGIVGRVNPLRELFDPHRKASTLDAIRTFVTENADFPFYFLADRLRSTDGSGVENVPAGSGKVVTLNGKRAAVHRRDDGTVVKVSAVCTHLGCLVRWNDAERTWDCPCHGSRFTPEGLVLGGPAEAPLEQIE